MRHVLDFQSKILGMNFRICYHPIIIQTANLVTILLVLKYAELNYLIKFVLCSNPYKKPELHGETHFYTYWLMGCLHGTIGELHVNSVLSVSES